MAAHKPIVSTSIKDVITLYGSVARIADTPEELVAQVQAALEEGSAERARRNEQEQELLGRYAWDTIAGGMHALIEDRLRRKLTARG
jgi:hypothetical protein